MFSVLINGVPTTFFCPGISDSRDATIFRRNYDFCPNVSAHVRARTVWLCVITLACLLSLLF